ncbi:hypothetical protein A1O3_08751 [Capronia epimyces CBS 606.96]|uniref:Kinetochore protein Mis13/DSN1 n=1 Tax=Capronia epimyces CBS 606.96 TaxID=1182542 RepID=W9XPI3_9EURO|nr:uncharacterized protein A1O3_08751 [Capronia epimyces CBS 606.96]EXJ79250.1 hypothetical protein A1O3_08751 [Capronia epimyces CBS 606.96]
MLVARQPLHPLPMSSTQRPKRRLSAQLQEKVDAPLRATRPTVNGDVDAQGSVLDTRRAQPSRASNDKKRKMNYDEEDDGFQFKRVKQKKSGITKVHQAQNTEPTAKNAPQAKEPTEGPKVAKEDVESVSQAKKRRHRLSFSTPKPKADAPVRRSKRLSRDNEQSDGSPVKEITRDDKYKRRRQEPEERPHDTTEMVNQAEPTDPPQLITEAEDDNSERNHRKENVPTQQRDQSATKIALPFADTPVIKRNKAMREGKSGKGERRSSLGLRGRRASSLIETGNSNALPHKEVEIPDFHKHIESEGLPEPRRMRQLLTWCATRALDEKPMGAEFEDASARAAARVVEEELLKDLSNKSELSDWFGREDAPIQKRPLPERPNPKNLQNIEKIAELEEQIKRLRAEKDALESLHQPPKIPRLGELDTPIRLQNNHLDKSLLSDADITALEASAASHTTSFDQISDRLNRLHQSLGPTIDTFADGIHAIGQYCESADNVAGRVLSLCAQRLAQREHEGRKRALPAAQGTPPKDLGGVLRSLSRADR